MKPKNTKFLRKRSPGNPFQREVNFYSSKLGRVNKFLADMDAHPDIKAHWDSLIKLIPDNSGSGHSHMRARTGPRKALANAPGTGPPEKKTAPGPSRPQEICTSGHHTWPESLEMSPNLENSYRGQVSLDHQATVQQRCKSRSYTTYLPPRCTRDK